MTALPYLQWRSRLFGHRRVRMKLTRPTWRDTKVATLRAPGKRLGLLIHWWPYTLGGPGHRFTDALQIRRQTSNLKRPQRGGTCWGRHSIGCQGQHPVVDQQATWPAIVPVSPVLAQN